NFNGQVYVILPKLKFKEGIEHVKEFQVLKGNELNENYRRHVGAWLEKLGELVEEFGETIEQEGTKFTGEELVDDIRERRVKKLKGIDASIHYVSGKVTEDRINNVIIPRGKYLTAVVTIQADKNTKRGSVQRLDILQKRGNKLLGGSTYQIVFPTKKK